MDITLNVQGQIFQTTYTTLINIPYFKNMFEDCCGNTNETITLNRPPHIFKHILSLATDPKYPYPEKYKFELDFFCFNYKNVTFYDIKKDIKTIMEDMENVTNEIKGIAHDITNVKREIMEMADDIQRVKIEIKNRIGKKCSDDFCENIIDDGDDYCSEHNNCGYYGCGWERVKGEYMCSRHK
jgi:hypothetical protein